ncbi:MAG: motility associated factor glycosyltransferase family protein [Lachnospiraceae bacterium]|nr:motility associated factor glycosyltransferase family protein [Lachnospiraceae bacterium]
MTNNTSENLIWEKNNAAFEKRYGFPIPEDNTATNHFRMGEAINGMPILYCVDLETGEETRLNSLYDPQYEAGRWAEKLTFRNVRTMIAMQGFLDGYFADAVLKRLTRTDSYVVIYEPDIAQFSFVCKHMDYSALFEDSRFVIYLPGHHKGTFYKTMSEEIVDIYRADLHMMITPPVTEIENTFYEDCNSLSNYLAADANTRVKLGSADTGNFLRVVKGLSTNSSISKLKEAFAGKDIPAVIVAAGPSLRKNVELLREINDKALIVAVDRAVPVLQEVGIKPHMTASVDAIKSPVFLESELVRDLPVLFYAMGNRATQDAHEGHLIYFGVGGSFFGIAGLDELLLPYGNVGGSVATAIFVCLQQIGVKNIILIGQDLAYAEDMRTHADGAMYNPDWHNVEEIPGVNGDMVKSRFDWMSFIQFYEQEMIANPELNVIDATEGGALIRGSKVMTFREAIDTYCTTSMDVAGLLSALAPAIDETKEKELREQILSFIPQLKYIKQCAEEGITFSNQVKKAAQYHKDVFSDYYVSKMKEAETRRSIIRLQGAYMLLESFAVLSKDDLPGDELFVRTEKDALEVYTQLSRYFALLRDKADPLIDEIRRLFDAEAFAKEQEAKEKEKESEGSA